MEKIEILASSMVELTEKLKLDQIKPPGIKSKITKAMDENGFTRFLKDSTNLCMELLCMVVYHKTNSLIDKNFITTTPEEVQPFWWQWYRQF